MVICRNKMNMIRYKKWVEISYENMENKKNVTDIR